MFLIIKHYRKYHMEIYDILTTELNQRFSTNNQSIISYDKLLSLLLNINIIDYDEVSILNSGYLFI